MKQAIGIVVAALLLFGGYQALQLWLQPENSAPDANAARGPAAIAVETALAKELEIERTLEAVGTTRALRSVEIVPLASGRIVEQSFAAGQKVHGGEPLLRLDDDIENADVKEAKAKLREAQLALERAESLRQSRAVTEATVDQLTAARITAEAELERAERRLADRVVRAPFAGVTGLKRVDLGARVDDSTVITTLDDLSVVEVEFALPETVFGEVQIGLPVIAESAAFAGKSFAGEVVAIDSRVDAVSRSFKVRASIPNADLALPAGMFVNLAVVLERRLVVMVPEEAVTAEGAGSFVFVAEGETARRRAVVTGQRHAGMVEIAEGVKDGERVVIRGMQRLREGSQINILGEEAEPATVSGGSGDFG
ncbi:efflux RND transporter periplasmic adaptor subunit [Afifella pfennigii]|uniref:efflux RND transporter periplasmic adaptor subunit n=1 Tax=Afifella pfennigii TaxID=209897 RepID=UPI001FE0B878|nr:efflux RND transporter periplasmic adaptor subunit [Afifella pfennigii]